MVAGQTGAAAHYLLDTTWVYNYRGCIDQGEMWRMFKKYLHLGEGKMQRTLNKQLVKWQSRIKPTIKP